MKKITLFFLILTIVIVTAACGSQNNSSSNSSSTPAASGNATKAPETAKPESGAKKRIVFVSPLIGHPVWLIANNGFQAAAKEMNFEASWVGPSKLSVEEMINAIETAIASKADGIISMGLNASAMGPVIKKAADAHIPLMLVNSDAPTTQRVAYFGSTAAVIGQVAAEGIAKKTGGKGKVAILTGALDAENLNASIKAFKERLAEKYPDLKIVATAATNSDMNQALTQSESLMTTYPDLAAVFCTDANGPIAMGNVIKEKGKAGKLTVIGMDDLDETLKHVQDGNIYGLIPQNFYAMGYLASKAILDTIAGKKVENITDTGSVLVTKDNISTYKQEMADFIKGK